MKSRKLAESERLIGQLYAENTFLKKVLTSLEMKLKEHQLQNYPNLVNALGDGIYGIRWITDIVSKSNVTPYFLPRSNVTCGQYQRR